MKKVTYLLIFIVVLFACNRNTREQNSEAEICEYEHSIINPELLRMARWAKMKKGLDDFHRGFIYDVFFHQRNDSNFVLISPYVWLPSPPPPPLERFYNLIGFTNIKRSGLTLTEECEVYLAKMSEAEKIFIYDFFIFSGNNISDDFLAKMVQYDALNSCQEMLWSLQEHLWDWGLSTSPPISAFVFFVNEQGNFILKYTF